MLDPHARAAAAGNPFAAWTLATLAAWTSRHLGSEAAAPVEVVA